MQQVRSLLMTIVKYGIPSFSSFFRSFNYHSMEYSTSIVCDGIDRGFDVANKWMLTVEPKYFIGIYVILDPTVQFYGALTAPLYDGVTLAMDLRLFQLVYADVLRRVGEHGNPKNFATRTQYETIANSITGMILGSTTFSIREKFGYAHADDVVWQAFLNESKQVDPKEIPIFSRYMEYIDGMSNVIKAAKRTTMLVDHFFLVRGAIMGCTSIAPEVIAASTVATEDDLDISDTVINNYQTYVKLVSSYNDVSNAEFETEFERLWYGLKKPNTSDMYTHDENVKIQAIRVNMRAKVKITNVIEDGTFATRTSTTSSYVTSDFKDRMVSENVAGDIRNISIFSIPITVILNNVGTSNAGKRRNAQQRVESIINTLPQTTNLIVPYSDFKSGTYASIDSLLSFFTSEISVRTREFQIFNDYELEFMRTGV